MNNEDFGGARKQGQSLPRWYAVTLPTLNLACAAGLVVLAWRTQRQLWQLDMATKRVATPGQG